MSELWNMKFGEKLIKIEWLDAYPGNLHTFEAALKLVKSYFGL